MEHKNGLQQATTKRQERFQGTGRTLPVIGPSPADLQHIKLPANFPGPESTPEEVKAYLLSRPMDH